MFVVVVVFLYFLFFSLSLDDDWTLMGVEWNRIRCCTRPANRQNENFDCCSDRHTPIDDDDDDDD